MKTEIINLDSIPANDELLFLLGKDRFRNYQLITEAIKTFLNPEREIWDEAGRRGKYYHGFRITSPATLIDLYLGPDQNNAQLKCEFKLQKAQLEKIKKNRKNYTDYTQKRIDSCEEMSKEFGGRYLEFFVDNQSVGDAICIITNLKNRAL